MAMKHLLSRSLLVFVASLMVLGNPLDVCSTGKRAKENPSLTPRVSVEAEATPDCDKTRPEKDPEQHRREQLARLGVDRWHEAGFRGQGIKIALLDTGFRGYRNHLGHALPAQVQVQSFRADGNLEGRDSQHGILCAEVLHALAPDAEILLANWDTDRPQSFLDAVRWAREQGARVISCSVIMPSWSNGQGGGRVDSELSSLLGTGRAPHDILFFASAGNTAQRHWSGKFRDGGDGWHEWKPGIVRNPLRPWGDGAVSVELYGRPGSDYDVYVIDATTGQTVAIDRSRPHEVDRCCAVARFNPRVGDEYEVLVHLAAGTGGQFHLVALGGALGCTRAHGSVACPADCRRVLAVGAVHRNGHRAAYSSCGSTVPVVKPDLVATVPFTSLWRPQPFTGTSAAAPQAAGLAALCWSRHPEWTAEQVHASLRRAARGLGHAGPDEEVGYGLVRLPPEAVATKVPSPTPKVQSAGPALHLAP